MATWWKKVVTMLTGDRLDQPPDGAAHPATEAHFSEHAAAPDGGSSVSSDPPDSSAPHDRLAEVRQLIRGLGEAVANLPATLSSLSDGQRDQLQLTAGRLDEVATRIAALNDALDHHLADSAGRADQIAGGVAQLTGAVEHRFETAATDRGHIVARLDALAAALDGLVAAGQARDRELAQLLEATQTGCEHMQRVREIVASLPEVAASQAESIASLDGHFEAVEQRSAAVADAVERHGRTLDEYKDALADMRRSVIALQQGQTELANHQQRIAESLSGLYDRTTQMTQLFKVSTLKLKQLAETPQTHHQELRAHVTAETERLTGTLGQLRKEVAGAAARGTIALVCSIIAAVAAIVACIGVFHK